MTEFDELIQQQLKLADQLIYTREEIQKLEVRLSASDEAMQTIVMEKKERLLLLEEEFEKLIANVISTFENTAIY
ncbi:hypothetical protein [Bacillus sp. RAR_GA_16]|uniref:hypothetical protein n=1 Tax=Bacillus sp. RAR_GA_16 TaxID=2876774 RepID=UPI001CC98731|nr:hypothetical protein [Bacillus sp. RAR_GA_16]MCA0173544.1 hypothetical protein [Bacillus sp. RAR_GA_16]